LHFESIESAYLIEFASYFSNELEALQALVDQGLVEVDAAGIQVTSMGWYFVRAVAMVFDRYLQTDLNRTRFSKIL
jgi:oxygen-independent coproporphyrinogen-3 oxidase